MPGLPWSVPRLGWDRRAGREWRHAPSRKEKPRATACKCKGHNRDLQMLAQLLQLVLDERASTDARGGGGCHASEREGLGDGSACRPISKAPGSTAERFGAARKKREATCHGLQVRRPRSRRVDRAPSAFPCERDGGHLWAPSIRAGAPNQAAGAVTVGTGGREGRGEREREREKGEGGGPARRGTPQTLTGGREKR